MHDTKRISTLLLDKTTKLLRATGTSGSTSGVRKTGRTPGYPRGAEARGPGERSRMPLTVRMGVFSSEKEPLQDDLDHPEGDGSFLGAAVITSYPASTAL